MLPKGRKNERNIDEVNFAVSADGLAIDIYTIMQIRLDLLQSDITFSDLAYKYNFSSPSSFSDYFKRNAGVSPQEYRMRNAGG